MNDAIATIRGFNRLYTQLVGASDARSLGSEVTLPEARLLFEIAVEEPRRLAVPFTADKSIISILDSRPRGSGSHWV